MMRIIKTKLNLQLTSELNDEYISCISDLLENNMIHDLDNYVHHLNYSRLEHCLHVSYLSYMVCKKRGLNYPAAARGGLLHDFYFYDSRHDKPERGIHCLCHPAIALENAEKHFQLNEVERDIIAKHMWPVTLKPPKYQESFVVTFLDKYCAAREFARSVGRYEIVRQTQC